MTIEIEITKTDLEAIRRRLGIRTKTSGKVVLNTLINVVVNDENALIYSQYEN